MKKLQRIDEYASRLLADAALSDEQKGLAILSGGGVDSTDSLNSECDNSSTSCEGSTNMVCTNTRNFCSLSRNTLRCDNGGGSQPIIDPCMLDTCLM